MALRVYNLRRLFSTAPNYFELFGLKRSFTPQQLKASYLELVKQHHPDLNKDPESQQLFKHIQEGYEVLSDNEKRIKYQQEVHPTQQEPAANSENFEEIKKRFYTDYKRKDELNDEYNFSHRLFKEHYDKIEKVKDEYLKYQGQGEEYYARKDEKGEDWKKQATYVGVAFAIIAAAYLFVQ